MFSLVLIYWVHDFMNKPYPLCTELLFKAALKATRIEYKIGAALHRCSYKKVFWKYGANLQEYVHAEKWF